MVDEDGQSGFKKRPVLQKCVINAKNSYVTILQYHPQPKIAGSRSAVVLK